MVGIFFNEASFSRLVTTYLVEYVEDWSVTRAYLSYEPIAATLLIAS
jgi:putative transposase